VLKHFLDRIIDAVEISLFDAIRRHEVDRIAERPDEHAPLDKNAASAPASGATDAADAEARRKDLQCQLSAALNAYGRMAARVEEGRESVIMPHLNDRSSAGSIDARSVRAL
jgi:hypothetical protein